MYTFCKRQPIVKKDIKIHANFRKNNVIKQ